MNERRQLRILYRDFLFRMVDLEVLSAHGDIRKLLGQFAALLGGLSFVLAFVMVLGYVGSRLPKARLLIAAWGDEEFLIGATIAVVGLFAVIAWNAVLPDRRDCLVLGPLPVRLRTIFLAKVAAIASAVGVSIVALNAFTGLSFGFIVIPANAGALGPLRSFGAYWLTMIAAGVFVFCALLAIQGIAAQLLSYRVFLRASSFLQLVAFFAILGVFFLTPPLATAVALAAPENQRLLAFLPSFWFLGLFHRLNGAMNPVFAPLAARALRNLGVAVSVAAVTYALAYYRHVRRIIEQPDIAPGSRSSIRIGGAVTRVLMARPLDRAILLFTARTLARSRHHRFLLAAYGGFGLAIALGYAKSLIYGYSREPWDQLDSPLLVGGFVVLLFSIVGARAVFALPATLPANWIFRISAVHSPFAHFSAVRKSLYSLAVLPIWALSGLAYLVIWPGRPAAEHVVVLALAGVFIVERSLLRFRKIPFTCSYLPGRVNLTVKVGIYAIVFLLVAEIVFGQAEFALLHRLQGFLTFAAVLLAAALWMRWRATAFARSTLYHLQFEELPPVELFPLDLRNHGPSDANQTYVDAIDPDPRLSRARLSFASVVLVLAAGFTYEQFGEWRDHRRLPQIGRSFDIGGRTMNLFCSGEGAPAVIFASGASHPGYEWVLIQPEVAKFTRACWYDRAGVGWSGPAEFPVSGESNARDLHALLAAAGIPPPYVLAGDAGGAFDACVYRGLYPRDVAGMVLADSPREDPGSQGKFGRAFSSFEFATLKFAAHFGLLRLFAPSPEPAPSQFTPEQWTTLWTLRWQPKALIARAGEPFAIGARQAGAAGGFGDLPLIVLTTGKAAPDQDALNEFGAELAWRSTFGRQQIVNTGPMIPEQAPEAVAEAVYEIFSQIRMQNSIAKSPANTARR